MWSVIRSSESMRKVHGCALSPLGAQRATFSSFSSAGGRVDAIATLQLQLLSEHPLHGVAAQPLQKTGIARFAARFEPVEVGIEMVVIGRRPDFPASQKYLYRLCGRKRGA